MPSNFLNNIAVLPLLDFSFEWYSQKSNNHNASPGCTVPLFLEERKKLAKIKNGGHARECARARVCGSVCV